MGRYGDERHHPGSGRQVSEQDPWKDAIEAATREAESGRASGKLAPPPPAASRLPMLWGALVLSVAALGGGSAFLTASRGLPTTLELEQGRGRALGIATDILRDYQRRNGSYPDSLPESVTQALGVQYRRIGDGYEVTATGEGVASKTMREP